MDDVLFAVKMLKEWHAKSELLLFLDIWIAKVLKIIILGKN